MENDKDPVGTNDEAAPEGAMLDVALRAAEGILRDGMDFELDVEPNSILEVLLVSFVAGEDGGAVPELAVDGKRTGEKEETGKGGRIEGRDRDV